MAFLLARATLLLCSAQSSLQLPRFEVGWSSSYSWLYNDDELHNPWYIDLGDVAVGSPGFLGGANVVTVQNADFCVQGCQEDYPDEFCSKYPPEGIPAKPRTVEDWGTKFNITSRMLTEGIEKIHAKGGKVLLSYGKYGNGICAESGGGTFNIEEIPLNAMKLAQRIERNVEDWNFDGVDFSIGLHDDNCFWAEGCPCEDLSSIGNRWNGPGRSTIFHRQVIKNVRELLAPSKTISLTSGHGFGDSLDGTVISSTHPYLDYITLTTWGNMASMEADLAELQLFGIPFNKVGFQFDTNRHAEYFPTNEEVEAVVTLVHERGLAGIKLSHINMENNEFRGAFARMVAQLLYL